jgi:RNA polymerase sigma factor (sigma-70 family)
MNEVQSLVRIAQCPETSRLERHRAFGVLVGRFQDMVYAYSFAVLGDFHLAQDVAQETFLKAYQELDKLETAAAFPGWLRQIVRTQCNRVTRRKRLPVVTLDESVDHIQDPEADPSVIVERRELQRQVMDAIQALPEHERTVTTLFYIDGYAQQDVADFLEVPVTTVQKRLQYARKKLKRTMISQVRENLYEQRLSRNTSFASRLHDLLRTKTIGDVQQVEALLSEDGSLATARGPAQGAAWLWGQENWTPLHRAAMQLHQSAEEHHHIIDLLLANGADINAQLGTSGWRPLHMALAFGSRALDGRHHALASFMISRGARIDAYTAAAVGDVDQLSWFIEHGKGGAQAIGPDGAMALHFAGSVRASRMLFDAGADLNQKDAVHGGTPLRWRVGLRWRDRPEHNAVARHLVEMGAQVDDVFLACALDDRDRATDLIRKSPGLVNSRTHQRDMLRGHVTPLHIAVFWRLPEMAELLLNLGADIDAVGHNDIKRPLITAAFNGSMEMIRLLLDHGADVNATDAPHGGTALHWAIYGAEFWWQDHENRNAVIEALLTAGADVTASNAQWNTPLSLAKRLDRSDQVALLRGSY